MIDQFATVKISAAYEPSEASTKHLAQQSPADEDNGLQFFGKDGFTFLDFLDVINPLQHIPIISSVYRSITNDSIEPGAKIAGGTLFGGPLGAALSSLDVAVKHRTGREIAEHTTAFFIGTIGDQNAPARPEASLKIAVLEPTQLVSRSNRDQKAVSVLQPIGAELKPLSDETMYPRPPKTQISEEKFRAAGMSAIPMAKHRVSGYGQETTNASRLLQGDAMLGDIAQPSPQQKPREAPKVAPPLALSVRAAKNEATKTDQDRLTYREPYRLEPKFTENGIPTAFSEEGRTQSPTEKSFTLTGQLYGPTQAINLTTTDNKSSWIGDAMRRGLSKYEAAKNLAPVSNQNAAASVR